MVPLNLIAFKSIMLMVVLSKALGSDDGICTRQKIVTKTRPQQYKITYTESYMGRCCCNYGYYYVCEKWETKEKYATKQEIYTALEVEKYCCTGYKEKKQTCLENQCSIECEPICDFICLNGRCSAPNQCSCNSGYIKESGTENICKPVCSEPCINSYCDKPEYCECNSGYEHEPGNLYICKPVCSIPCVNAICTLPNVCKCIEGYRKMMEDRHKCYAHCSLPCHNGVCTAPNNCTCFEGYEKDRSSWNICNPVCSKECLNGQCTAPEKCTCFDGFENNQSNYNCSPVCSSCSQNEFCSAPNICSCKPGYERDPYSLICLPVCSFECENGRCVEPNRCECLPGFEETDVSWKCRPYCSDGCENGVCTGPEECSCLWGFYNEGNSSSNCSRLTEVYHDCKFDVQFKHHNYSNYCFSIDKELEMKGLNNCKIFNNLIDMLNEKGINVSSLSLNCNSVSNVQQLKNVLLLNLSCEVMLVLEEENISKEIPMTSTIYSSETTNSYEVSIEDEFSNISYSVKTEDDSDLVTIKFKDSSTTIEDHTINNENDVFNILSDKPFTTTSEFSEFVVTLNTTLKFFPLIKNSQITQQHFYNVTSTKQELCICNQSLPQWKLCANTPVQLTICPCKPLSLKVQTEETSSSLRIVTMILMSIFIVVLLALYSMNLLQKYSSVMNSS